MITTFDGTPVLILIDITVVSTLVVSNHARAVKNKCSSGLADHGAHLKDLKHSHYLHQRVIDYKFLGVPYTEHDSERSTTR